MESINNWIGRVSGARFVFFSSEHMKKRARLLPMEIVVSCTVNLFKITSSATFNAH